ncbi:MAG: response regulator [Prevotella sp.]|nr:response regulator [Prevotella sp.]
MKRSLLSLTFVLLLVTPLFGVTRQGLPFRNITMEDGLLANGVRNIVQDRYGFIWFGTDNGLCRYDGVTIRPFRIMDNGTNQFVSALMADTVGLYVGTDKGVFFFHFQTERFERLAPEINVTVRGFSKDQDGNVWISVDGRSIYCYVPKTGSVSRYTSPAVSASMTIVYADAQNHVWAIGGNGEGMVARLNKVQNRFETIPLHSTLDDFGSYSMLQMKDGTLWLGTWNNGLLRLNDDATLEQMLNPTLTGVGSHIHCLYELSPTELLIGCDDGLISYNPQDHSWRRMMADGTAQTSITDRFVYSVMGDNEGGLWYGTFYGGVSYLSPMAGRFESYSSSNGLRGNVIARFCEDGMGRIWIASDDGGLNCYSQRDAKFVDFPSSAALSRYNIHSLCMDGGALWIGTYSDGVIQLDIATGRMRHYSYREGLLNPSAYSLFMDSKHQLWVGTMDDLCRYDREEATFKRVKSMGALVIDIDEDGEGNIWVATQGNGIFRYRPSGNAWTHYASDEKNHVLSTNEATCVCFGTNGKLWVTTVNGLFAYNKGNDCFDSVPLDIPSNDCSGILEDGGVLWISTAKGLVRYVEGESVQVFTRQDGLVSEQFQPNSVLKATDGKLFFGTARGFNAFYPYQIKVNRIEPPVFITALKLYNKTVEVGTGQLKEALPLARQIDLSYQEDMFSLTFAALSYCSPGKNQYAYMLEGFDKDWNYVGDRNEATYTNIPYGTYTFRVKATNNDGVWSSHDATLKIVVHPPFWLTLPAKILYLLLLLAAIWLFTQFRLQKAEQRHQEELARLNEKNEAEVRDARLKFFTMIAHEIRTPVSLIIGPLEKLNEDSSFLIHHSSFKKDLDVIDRNAHRLLELVNQLLDFNKVEQQGMQLRLSLCNVKQLIRAVSDRFAPTLQQRNATLTVNDPPADFTAIVDEEAITKVVSNLMTNATKYTKDNVTLSCTVDDDHQHFHITVEDNGVGISDAEQKKIFRPFYQSKDNKPGTGIGLSIVQTLVSLHHGDVHVVSEEGKGARFVVTLPVTQGKDAVVDDGKNMKELKDYKNSDNCPQNTDGNVRTPELLDTPELHNSQPTVLIVEDDEDMLHFLSDHFRDSYTVITAENGVQGLKQLKKYPVTLIVSDWMMPEMDGAEFCRKVRANSSTSHLPLVLLTAKTDNDSKTMGMDVGADAYIEKPFSMKYLEATIRNLMEMRRLLLDKFSRNATEAITEMAKTPLDNEFLVKLNRVIEDNINNNDLSVAFIASEMGISRSGLFAKLKALTDATPNEMIQIVRLRRAAMLLQEGRYRINEVCYMVGFSSPSYFSKCFQQQFGMKPGEYVKSVHGS